jgi:hypothetical protein
MGPPPGASPPMRMTASWSVSKRTFFDLVQLTLCDCGQWFGRGDRLVRSPASKLVLFDGRGCPSVDHSPDGGAVLEMLAGFLLRRHRHAGHYGLDDLVPGPIVQPICETLEALEEPAPELRSINQVWLYRERTEAGDVTISSISVRRGSPSNLRHIRDQFTQEKKLEPANWRLFLWERSGGHTTNCRAGEHIRYAQLLGGRNGRSSSRNG